MNWRAFFGMIAVVALIAFGASRLLHFNFWVVFGFLVGAVVVNGLVAMWEDEEPGGFNNPHPDQGRDSTKEKT